MNISERSPALRNIAPQDGDLVAAIANAIDNDQDPAADPDAQRLQTAARLANLGVMALVDAIAAERFRRACTDNANQIVTAWQAEFDKAAARLAAARQVIGDVPLDDIDTIANKGGQATDAWLTARAATQTITSVVDGGVTLDSFTRAMQYDRHRYQVLTLAAAPYDTWTAQQLEGRRLTPWEALLAGLTLSLPTYPELRVRVQVIQQGQQQAADARERVNHAHMTNKRPDSADIQAAAS